MRKISCMVLILGLTFISGCNLPKRQPVGDSSDALLVVTPVKTETSPFAPVLTATATSETAGDENNPQPAVPAVTATLGLLPGLQYRLPERSQTVTITNFDMVDLVTGWGEWAAEETGASGSLLRTEDGGKTWSVITPPSGYPTGSRFFALDGRQAWVVPAILRSGALEPESLGEGFVWRTVDGGTTWSASTPVRPRVQEEALLESFLPQVVHFLDPQHGWLVVSIGHYMNQDVFVLLNTEDGGLTWKQLTDKFSMSLEDGPGAPCKVSGIAFTDSLNGFLAGDCMDVGVDDGFSILTTQDGGRTWTRQELPNPNELPEALQNAADDGPQTCAPTGVENTPAGILVQHTCRLDLENGGYGKYFFLSLDPEDGSGWRGWAGESASFTSPSVGYSLDRMTAEGMRSLRKTSDGGKTWTDVHTVTWSEARLDFPVSGQGFALAWQWDESAARNEYALVRTENDGALWSLVDGKVR